MPELPEVEVVRAGMQRHFAGARITDIGIRALRSVRRHLDGPQGFSAALADQRVVSFERRGKFIWALLDDPNTALVVHLGMSGQVLAQRSLQNLPVHARVILSLKPAPHMVFSDQRMFGGMHVDALIESAGRLVPQSMAHIAADPFEPVFDVVAVAARMRRSNSAVKSVLLNQQVVSGIGNIYADEALWRAKLDWARPASNVSLAKLQELLDAAKQVMGEALAAGGTSFDSMYVNVNGSGGYFSRSLNAYGREGEPCPRCGGAIIREKFENRSAFRCTRCQRRQTVPL